MDILLDSNIYIRDPLQRSVEFEMLLDFLQSSDAELILPELVLAEVVAAYKRELNSRISRLETALRLLNGFIANFNYPRHEILLEDQVEQYKTDLLCRFGIGSNDVRPINPDHLKDVLYRAVGRRRPCSDKGGEIRDAVIWLHVLDAAAESFDDAVAFVSANTSQFAEANRLHPDLLREAAERNAVVNYYTSLAEFLQSQSPASVEYSREWFLTRVTTSDVLAAASSYIDSEIAWEFESKVKRSEPEPIKPSPTGYSKVLYEEIEIAKYFLYAMHDGTMRGLAIFHGQIEVEFEYEHEVDTANDASAASANFLRFDQNRHRFPYAWKTELVHLSPQLEIYVAFTAIDGQVTEWYVQNA